MKSPLRRIQEKADKLWQISLLEKNKFCFLCGALAQVIHHYIPKSVSSALRYYIPNGIPLCNKCHCHLHSSPDPTKNLTIKQKKGDKWWKDLQKERQKQIKPSIKYYQEIINALN